MTRTDKKKKASKHLKYQPIKDKKAQRVDERVKSVERVEGVDKHPAIKIQEDKKIAMFFRGIRK